MHLER